MDSNEKAVAEVLSALAAELAALSPSSEPASVGVLDRALTRICPRAALRFHALSALRLVALGYAGAGPFGEWLREHTSADLAAVALEAAGRVGEVFRPAPRPAGVLCLPGCVYAPGPTHPQDCRQGEGA